MKKIKGRGISDNIAIGRACIVRRDAPIANTPMQIDDVQKEIERLEAAKIKAIEELNQIYEKIMQEAGEESALIFGIHIMMIEDEEYSRRIIDVIEKGSANAEYAVMLTAEEFAKKFSEMSDEYMQARSADVMDISERIVRCLSAHAVTGKEMSGIICAEDLAPSETADLSREKVKGFVTAKGSANSHTAILARSMGIPAVVNAGEDFLSEVNDGDLLIVDGNSGEVIISPDEETLKEYAKKQELNAKKIERYKKLHGAESITKDGKKIKIYANIGSLEDISQVKANDAEGIGLFRSEFIYLKSADYPTEEQQYEIYRKVLESMQGREVVIRTLDIGADKQAEYFGLAKEENPAMGLRAIRICLTREEIFLTQLRALYKASVHGKLRIMFPMITSVTEVEKCIEMCEKAKSQLKGEGKSYSGDVEIGIMIETPAAALISDKLAPLVDFFSVGTNDLTQYTLACDRQNPMLESFVDTHHEAVLRLIEMSAENAHKSGKWIGICGELAADTTLTERFLRMGIDELSVSPVYVLPLREVVREIDLSRKLL